MDEHIIQEDDEDREALAALSSVPLPQRKIHCYSQQLRASSAQKRYHQVRKHSLDGIPKPSDLFYNNDDSSDDEFFPYYSSSSSNNAPSAGEYIITHTQTERLDQNLSLEPLLGGLPR